MADGAENPPAESSCAGFFFGFFLPFFFFFGFVATGQAAVLASRVVY